MDKQLDPTEEAIGLSAYFELKIGREEMMDGLSEGIEIEMAASDTNVNTRLWEKRMSQTKSGKHTCLNAS